MKQINRREALKGFGAVSLASFLEFTPGQIERALNGMAALAEPEEQQQAYTPRFFARGEWRTVSVLVDYIIPRDARSGSATEAKVPEFMDWLLADKEASESSKVSMRGGLAWLNQESRKRFGRSFVAASDAQRRQILDAIAWPAKAPTSLSQGVAFFTRMRDFTASGFFSSAMGWQDLQYIGNVSNPGWNGCPPAAMTKLGVTPDIMGTRPTRNG
ncbi:MAG TPA: gluconate 2-dehydrogenase subunit 3 family protein [Gemmatimonadaceae bacterium]|nr:gluconate 2-dehydrogenase subunit 3 family protein [Gemmatimonadaceae bacterium]